jgi:catechol 2,3-dioxygenase-like lactoylglutathione lyase family enzyme
MGVTIDHAGITVGDLDRAIAFYRDGIGLQVQMVFERDDETIAKVVGMPGARLRIAFMRAGDETTRLELLQYLDPRGQPLDFRSNQPGSGHVCFRVDDVAAAAERLRAAGATLISDGPVELLQGPNAGARVMYLRDPEGAAVEIFQPPSGA